MRTQVCVCCVCAFQIPAPIPSYTQEGFRDAGDFQFSVSIATPGRMGTASVTLIMAEEGGEGEMEGMDRGGKRRVKRRQERMMRELG